MVQCEGVWSDIGKVELIDSYGNRAEICVEACKLDGLNCVIATSTAGGHVMKYGISYGADGMREVLYTTDGSHVVEPNTGKQFEELRVGPFEIQRVFPDCYHICVYGVQCVEAIATDESVDVSIDIKDTYETEQGPKPVSTVMAAAEIGRMLVLMVANGWYSCSRCIAIKNVLNVNENRLSSVFKAAEGK